MLVMASHTPGAATALYPQSPHSPGQLAVILPILHMSKPRLGEATALATSVFCIRVFWGVCVESLS